MAEREGFEPSIPVKVYRISSPARSTTLPPFLAWLFYTLRGDKTFGFYLASRAKPALAHSVRRTDYAEMAAGSYRFSGFWSSGYVVKKANNQNANAKSFLKYGTSTRP